MHKLAVKLEGIERRKRTTGLLHIAAGCFLLVKGWDYYRLFGVENPWPLVLAIVVGIISVAYGLLKKSWDPGAIYNSWVRMVQVAVFAVLAVQFIAAGRAWEITLLFIWSVGCLLLMFTERKVFHDAEMLFGREGIFIPGYFTNRRLFWTGIAEVVIRPDFVTIFKKDDSFLQYEVLKNLPAAQLDEITLYCRQQIAQATKMA